MSEIPDSFDELPLAPDLTEREKEMFDRGMSIAPTLMRKHAAGLAMGTERETLREWADHLDRMRKALGGG